MTRKPTLPTIAKRIVDDGIICTYDRNDRLCLDVKDRERVVLNHDLRAYGPSLHIGALGWTIPETSDGYKEVTVEFDTGQRLRLKRYIFDRVVPEFETEVAQRLMARWRDTRFDANVETAKAHRERWIAEAYGKHLSLESVVYLGEGDQELYAFTFPTLIELAKLRGDSNYPVKIGYTGNLSEGGAYGRIRSFISEMAGYPDRPVVLCIVKTWAGRHLETQVHRVLRERNRRCDSSLGKEWYQTSAEELLEIVGNCETAAFNPERTVVGATETLSESFGDLMAEGKTVEMGMVPGEASVFIRIRDPVEETEGRDRESMDQ